MSVWQQAMTDPLLSASSAVFFAVFALVMVLGGRQSPVAGRLARHAILPPAGAGLAMPLPVSPWQRWLRRHALLGRLLARFSDEKSSSEARALLNRAGSTMSVQTYARLRMLCTLALTPLLFVLVLFTLGMKPLGLASAALVVLVVPRLPANLLKRMAKRRAQQMDLLISDVLDLLVVCVEGGQSLSAALMQVSQRMDNIAADEFRRLLADINGGMSRREAFSALADRCQSEALGIACSTIIHADKVGMSLASTLRTLSDSMRTRRRQAAETRARQAPIKMMPVLVGFMLPTLLALLLGPVVLEVMANF